MNDNRPALHLPDGVEAIGFQLLEDILCTSVRETAGMKTRKCALHPIKLALAAAGSGTLLNYECRVSDDIVREFSGHRLT